MLLYALVKIKYKSWLDSELAMENASYKASKGLKIMDSIWSVKSNALISNWIKACGLEPTEKSSDLDEDELIEFELLQLKEPDKPPIQVSDDEIEPNPAKTK